MENREVKQQWEHSIDFACNAVKELGEALNGLLWNEGKYYRKRNKKFVHFNWYLNGK